MAKHASITSYAPIDSFQASYLRYRSYTRSRPTPADEPDDELPPPPPPPPPLVPSSLFSKAGAIFLPIAPY